MAKCTATKASGQGCNGEALPGAKWCWSHDPAHAQERRRNAAKGGRRGGKNRPGTSPELTEVKALLKVLVSGVLVGKVDRADAAVVNQLLNTRLRAVEVERKLLETQELEARLEALEELSELEVAVSGGKRPRYGN